MPNAAAHRPNSWIAPALAVTVLILAVRIALLSVNETDLFVDEAQYWLWGQDLAWGYYSKPPLVAWVIRLSTDLAGSDAPFWVRLPAPVFHAVTAMILAAIAARVISPRAAVLVAAGYMTLPLVAVGSLLISTDTVMFPFLALALLGYVRLLEPGGQGRAFLAALVGVALGLAFLAKYAAAYYLCLATLAALHPRLRPAWRDATVLLAVFAAVSAPNLLWNLSNSMSTLSHTIDNTGWREGIGLAPEHLLRFLGEQALVIGPVVALALLIASAAVFRTLSDPRERLLAVLALPIVLLVSVQALISGANANWAAAAYLSGSVLAFGWMAERWRGWRWLSFSLNGLVCLALPILTVWANDIRMNDRLLLARYLGLEDLSHAILTEAGSRSATAIVAAERAVLADLFYTGREARVPVYAWPVEGPPPHHYAQRHSYGGGATGPVMAVTRGEGVPPCAVGLAPDDLIVPGPGAYLGSTFRIWLVPPDCWSNT